MALLQGIEAVTFDVGGTLIEPWPSVGHVYAEVAARHGVKAPDVATLNRQFAAAWKGKGEFDYSKDSWFALVAKTFGTQLETLPPGFLEDLYAHFGEPVAWRVRDDVVPAFDELASLGLDLGVISNWDERLRPLLHKLKLTSFLNSITISCDIGFTKPSPVIFEQALKDLGAPPQSVLHVGDNHREDVEGATGAGLHAVRLDREGKGDVKSLKEIAALLD
ncbi:MAG: HAD-IA family hydrolase [Verrucomicrobiota bacterium]